jgi:hypothetical protein
MKGVAAFASVGLPSLQRWPARRISWPAMFAGPQYYLQCWSARSIS